MNIAILIGVSDYIRATKLPACKNDVQIINKVITHSGKYESVLLIDSETSSASVKEKVSNFIRQHENETIEEIFFYFSGHGMFTDGEFHYALTDYDPKRIKNTTYENSEIDQLIKSLSPDLTVKIVDACNAGVNYIKDLDGYSKALHDRKSEFKHCYFMLSSESSQNSFADNNLSFFTKSFIECIANSETESIRYKDLMDYISDSFMSNKEQTPLFINQANYTEIFISQDSSLKEILNNSLRGLAQLQLEKIPQATLIDRIKEDSKRFMKQEEAMAIYKKIIDIANENKKFKNDGKNIFDVSVLKIDDYKPIPKISQISKWLHSHPGLFFASPTYAVEIREKKVLKNRHAFYSSLMRMGGLEEDDDYKTVEEKINVPKGVENIIEVPFKALEIKAVSLFDNVNSSTLYIVPFISRTQMVVFNYVSHSITVGWDGEVMQDANELWESSIYELIDKDKIFDHVRRLFEYFEAFSLEPIKRSLGIQNEEKLEAENTVLQIEHHKE
ncbi:caspase family protein [Rahnella inusitata]|uniref:caspase family protein n=1 Tax=Rahnella inusitata TaxID=58169 RepID=UPI001BC84377|nr:caspase family protein [Rahnella inusitata]QUT15543.1 caspase family protein [Rahnella inusitata]